MRNIIFILFIYLLIGCNGQKNKSNSESSSKWTYPLTRIVDSANTYWGVTYKDPYRWLENFKDSAVVKWFKKQAILTDSVMNHQFTIFLTGKMEEYFIRKGCLVKR
jgi:prolyl oligopeptidase